MDASLASRSARVAPLEVCARTLNRSLAIELWVKFQFPSAFRVVRKASSVGLKASAVSGIFGANSRSLATHWISFPRNSTGPVKVLSCSRSLPAAMSILPIVIRRSGSERLRG